ncbi:MAG: peptidylprolyl isomerase [Allomuricauda sp.]|nr:MAG: peptidylprolyl isomerase [Allomuricauda sp.]
MNRKIIFPIILLLLFTACKTSKYADLGDGIFADIQTTKGDIVIKLYHDATPVTVASFVSLAEGSSPFVSDSLKEKKYYDGLIFHRVMKDFMIQGGDPLGIGRGGPGYQFKDEFVDSLTHSGKGVVSMANPGPPNTNGSQFFITHKETPWLNGKHTIFGEVVKGIEVVDTIADVEVAPPNKPVEDVVMNKVEIIRNGKEARQFDAIQVMSDYFKEVEEKEAAILKTKTDFLAEAQKQKETAEKTASGLMVYKLREGTGEKPKIGQWVMVNYAGWIANDGSLVDTSVGEIAQKFGNYAQIYQMHRGSFAPSRMQYSPEARLIAGFKEGLQTMKVGDKVRLFIPPHIGYGAYGSPPVIPPNADLIFDLELVSIAE